MFPIRDHNPSGRTPFVTIALILVNGLVFLAYFPSSGDLELQRFYMTWGLVPGRVLSGDGSVTLLTHMFLHGGWMHLAGNMLFLWIYGDNLEEEMGHVGFLLFYLAAGLAAAGLQIAPDPGSGVPMVGASGAIAGVMGGYLLLFPKAKVDVLFIIVIFIRVIALPAWVILGLWLVLQVVSGFATPMDGGGVAYFAHIGGFIAGLILTVPVWKKRGAWAYWQRTEGHPPHPVASYPLEKTKIPRVGRD
ncbi:rhomboid family intramembrane serine protease [Rhodobacter sp. Har01]|uniref:rhomboid family intramembrane serine protease n=1 Tax=Rhodobacter sp. Har01 TaxID=2883999 RepID=UPI001D05D977|nr:rhomboid family intramembrane serine protease [Rhodobacter sp. Har01]MCB6179681.1 rhomboid family intramembrane serine protease [Rhodobacter sp. Har01]